MVEKYLVNKYVNEVENNQGKKDWNLKMYHLDDMLQGPQMKINTQKF